MPVLTLAFIFRGDKILLAMKKRGFGVGKWNGYGGKLSEGETPLDGIVREIEEESGIVVEKNNCKELGYLDFYFNDKEEWNQGAIIYRVDEFVGEPKETEEMSPKWYSFNEIPYDSMWGGDSVWLPKVIVSENFTGKLYFENNGEKLVSITIQ